MNLEKAGLAMLRTTGRLLLRVILGACVACGMLRAQNPPHPDTRTAPSPSTTQVNVNPPPLLWPATKGDGVSYLVRLSRHPSFPADETISSEKLRWAMFNPHRKLEQGRWYWQYAVVTPDQSPAWSDSFWFEVDGAARAFVTPPASTIVKSCPPGHPRLLATAAELPELRRRAAGTAELAQIIAAADRGRGRKLPLVEAARPKEKGANAFEQRAFARVASKEFAGAMARDISALAVAFLLTGEGEYAREAVRRAMAVAALDPEGDTSPRVSDFADGSCLAAMALAYDSCHEFFTPEQQPQLRKAMRVRTGRFFEEQINHLEVRGFNAHIWQELLLQAGEAALASLGEIPEADTWCAYFYELWVNRFPPMGGDDGGWAEGHNYQEYNMETMLRVPALFNRLAGAGSQDFYDLPWYRNAAYFLIYGWRPGSHTGGFGDGVEIKGTPNAMRAFFAEALALHFGDGNALWYAQEVYKNSSPQSLPPLLLMYRLRELAGKTAPAPGSPRALPQSRAFPDVGLVAMHSDLADVQHDVFLGFCSCPFGGSGHMHPCQNAFNLLVGGRRLFANSGYYIGFGDEHYKGWYSATRGHNAILIDGKGQRDASESYGEILRFTESRECSYALGDASQAYGEAGVKLARRHVVLLRPSTIVIYDDLAADHAGQWSWLLHSPARITAAPQGVRLSAEVPTGNGEVEVFGSQPLQVSVDQRFDPPAKNWLRKNTRGKAGYPDQWHATVTSPQPAGKMRFLAILQVGFPGERRPLDPVTHPRSGQLKIGPWRIVAELDPEKKATLTITDARGQTILAADENGK